MNSIKTSMAVQIPSHFGMPICAATPATAALTGGRSSVVRERLAVTAATAAGLGFVPAYVPGTSAWSPPT